MSETHPLDSAIADLRKATAVNIKGKSYTTVATRLEVFRRHFPDYGITTDLLPADGKFVRVRAMIFNDEERVIASGMAEEDRSWGQINKTSAIENCETSAVGRALGNFGLHGGEYASADEMDLAFEKQDKAKKAQDQAEERMADAVEGYLEGQGPAMIAVEDNSDERVRWKNWCGKFKAAIEKTTSPDEGDEWWKANDAPLGNLKRAFPKNYDKLHDLLESRKAQLFEAAGLGPLDAG